MKSPHSSPPLNWSIAPSSSPQSGPSAELRATSKEQPSFRPPPEKRLRLRILQGFGVLLATVWLCIYLCFRAYYINFTGWLAPFAVLLFAAELHTIAHSFGMLYSLWPRKYESWPNLNKSRDLQCNMFICVCGEPVEVVRETALAALETARVYQRTINPFHPPRVIMLNDGRVAKKDNWRDVEAMCAEIGITHIARTIPGGYKAGNINNGLKETPTSDPFNTLDIVFDSDFCALPEFLVEITKPFVDKTIDWVQTPQRYQNEETWVAKASAAHQIFFFEHICPAKGYDNALFLCGTNFAIRRSALDVVGGINTDYITEDYATSLDLHIEGRRGVFMPQVLALGMAPTSLKQYFTQQRRWSKGSFDTSKGFMRELLFGKMKPKQKMHYLLSATYYLIGLRDLIMMLAPVPYLFFGVSLIRSNSLFFLLFIYLPMVVPNFILYVKLFRHPLKSLVLDVVSFPVFTSAFFQSLFGQKLGFVVTIKKYEKENPFAVYKSQTIVGITLIIGLLYSLTHFPFRGLGMGINYWWACFNVSFLIIGFALIAKENFSWGTWATVDQEKAGVKRQALQGMLRPKTKLAPKKPVVVVSQPVVEAQKPMPVAAVPVAAVPVAAVPVAAVPVAAVPVAAVPVAAVPVAAVPVAPVPAAFVVAEKPVAVVAPAAEKPVVVAPNTAPAVAAPEPRVVSDPLPPRVPNMDFRRPEKAEPKADSHHVLEDEEDLPSRFVDRFQRRRKERDSLFTEVKLPR